MHRITVLILGDMDMNRQSSPVGVKNSQLASVVAAFGLFAAAAQGSVIFTWSGPSSASNSVSFEADLTFSGNTLTLVLMNNSPTNSLAPNDLLGSFYFDIVGTGNTRPTLTYLSAVGDVYTGDKNNPDPLLQASADLTNLSNSYGWMFKAMNVATNPPYAFGVGCVGNNNLTPNNFPALDGIDGSIYRTDIISNNLDGNKLVKNTATFTFSGVSGFAEADLAQTVLFGMGTQPDSTHIGTIIPEPSSFALAVAGIALLGWVNRRRR
jgi:hypothetical protein